MQVTEAVQYEIWISSFIFINWTQETQLVAIQNTYQSVQDHRDDPKPCIVLDRKFVSEYLHQRGEKQKQTKSPEPNDLIDLVSNVSIISLNIFSIYCFILAIARSNLSVKQNQNQDQMMLRLWIYKFRN